MRDLDDPDFAIPSRALVWWSRLSFWMVLGVGGAVLLAVSPLLSREPIFGPEAAAPATSTPTTTEAPMKPKLTPEGLGPIKIGMPWDEALTAGMDVVVDLPTCRLARYQGALVAEGDGKVISVTVQNPPLDPAHFPENGLVFGTKDGVVVYVRAGTAGAGC